MGHIKKNLLLVAAKLNPKITINIDLNRAPFLVQCY